MTLSRFDIFRSVCGHAGHRQRLVYLEAEVQGTRWLPLLFCSRSAATISATTWLALDSLWLLRSAGAVHRHGPALAVCVSRRSHYRWGGLMCVPLAHGLTSPTGCMRRPGIASDAASRIPAGVARDLPISICVQRERS